MLLNDRFYGLGLTGNYQRWNVLKDLTDLSLDQSTKNKMFAFQAELRSAFGLTVNQVNCATDNWVSLYGIEESELWQSFSGPN